MKLIIGRNLNVLINHFWGILIIYRSTHLAGFMESKLNEANLLGERLLDMKIARSYMQGLMLSRVYPDTEATSLFQMAVFSSRRPFVLPEKNDEF